MARTMVGVGCILGVLTGGFALATVRGEQAAPQDTSALLDEVRLLRQAIEALAGTGARVQIVFGRLQLQEQRTTSAVRRLDDARSALATITAKIADIADRVKTIEDDAGRGTRAVPEERAFEIELRELKREWARREEERIRLATQESDAAGQLAQEQGRWTDLNRQLEELERALTPRK
jgi:chromosome segregation ATPase